MRKPGNCSRLRLCRKAVSFRHASFPVIVETRAPCSGGSDRPSSSSAIHERRGPPSPASCRRIHFRQWNRSAAGVTHLMKNCCVRSPRFAELDGERRSGREFDSPHLHQMPAGAKARSRHLKGVIWFRQAAQVPGYTARQATDVNSAKPINAKNVYAKVTDGLTLKYGVDSGNDGTRFAMAA